MDLLKSIDWSDVATKHDVDRLASELDRLAGEVDHLAESTKHDGDRLARDIDRVAIATTRDLEEFARVRSERRSPIPHTASSAASGGGRSPSCWRGSSSASVSASASASRWRWRSPPDGTAVCPRAASTAMSSVRTLWPRPHAARDQPSTAGSGSRLGAPEAWAQHRIEVCTASALRTVRRLRRDRWCRGGHRRPAALIGA